MPKAILHPSLLLYCAFLFFAAACSAAAERAAMTVTLPEGPYPKVFLTRAEQEAIRVLANSDPSHPARWAPPIRDAIIAEADALLEAALDIPRAEGQWTHWYTCKEDGAGLRPDSPTLHVCTVCGKTYTGNPYDQVYVTLRHTHWLRAIETLGRAYALDPNPAYAARARAILLAYASFYGDLKLHNVHGEERLGGGRLFAQTLDEAVALCHLLVGYDLVYDAACFSEEDHTAIAEKLIRPICATIRPNNCMISNWQSWHNAAVGAAGFLLGDEELVDWAVNGPAGFLFQMRRSVMDSGMWYEGAPAYHWYALYAHLYLLEAAARAGMDLYALPVVKKMFDAPARLIFPDGTFPAIHDSDRTSIFQNRDFYEVAYRRYRDRSYVRFLTERNSPIALFWGVDGIPPSFTLEPMTSSNEISEGLAILRDGSNETALFFDYGPAIGGHTHPAKLGVILYAHGDERLVDPGRLSYGNPMHNEWYRQTIAHNAVVVNATSQTTAAGKLVAFGYNDAFSLVRATCDGAYKDKGVFMDRTTALFDDKIIDVLQCRANQDVTFDLPLHFRGELPEFPEAEEMASLADTEGYRVLKRVRRLTAPPRSFDVACGNERRMRVHMSDTDAVYVADGYGNPLTEIIPVVLRRSEGRSAVFITAIDLRPGDASDGPMVTMEDGVVVSWHGAVMQAGDNTCFTSGNTRYFVGPDGLKH